ncbi:MAG: 3-hydroxyacyl-CoA dehydrogenase [Rhodospirillaceae bacterium]|jgi:3-hydroxyacyl-CoA dehydrogenase|nr:3-hydroxyacyl-CoA dehydrogenase [Rhodospirillaceae bacterium]MBT5944215.1 3-hydroxyacyl-CoA dehydrogenase [Rhodospirillaceae bacterium]MBT6403628.1 3-hydroxyacyl-CoA dehydrogenase [Rhodospirillaceae bacterium]MBT6536573.1 3-hydroxyacyl-CoA dehydrogenase [Rhodospirillaceae bacterium]MBT7360850.1 3-hydroxyacyl-CoA dehydrogenase [Rhodospirillaceae bacterium]
MNSKNTNEPVQYRKAGAVAVITINNPPVNALAKHVRMAIADYLETAANDHMTSAVVICGNGRNLCGGADIREFNTPNRQVRPMTRDLMNLIEAMDKPVVAAIHGPTLGGGLELALGCHYRVAHRDARLGLPEVLRGVIPGAGGTQRLPRLVGFREALEMITSGTPVDGATAQEIGLVDRVAEDDDVCADAIRFAEDLVADNAGPRRVSDMPIDLDAEAGAALVAETRAKLEKTARGMQAPFRCLESVANTLAMSFADGWAREAEISTEAVASDESRSLVHGFFAERQVSKIPDIPADTPRRLIKRTAIVGAGTMGGGIAMSFANAGMPVTLIDSGQSSLDRGIARIRENYAATRDRGRLSAEDMDARMGLITGAVGIAAAADADLVIEAVFEEMDIKQKIFRELDALARDGAILATNTSTLDVDAIAAVTKRPGDVLGLHFFSPANVMTLLEIVRAEKTEKDVIATVLDLSARIGKTGVVVGVCDGFVGNRMLAPFWRQGDFLVEEGALPQDVDRVMEEFGFRMGPFRVSDLAGLDISWAIDKRRAETRPADERFSPLLDRICELGRFGQKTGAGWYRYEGRNAVPDAEIESLISMRSEEMGITRRNISEEEIRQRCIYQLINEGAKILEEGMAIRASDVDVVWLHGYGFPRWRGGPMFYADMVGLPEIVATMDRFHGEWGDKWEPAALLRELADAGSSFKEWDAGRTA